MKSCKLWEINEQDSVPSRENFEDIQNILGISIAPKWRVFITELWKHELGKDIEVFFAPQKTSNILLDQIEDARTRLKIKDLIPFLKDNDLYGCINQNGELVFVAHNGKLQDEIYDSPEAFIFATWEEELQSQGVHSIIDLLEK